MLALLAINPGGTSMKSLVAASMLLFAMASAGAADRALEPRYSPVVEQFTYSFVAMPLLPRRLQNHCGYFRGHFICADHCGLDYQVYYCSNVSTGCCHIGKGYCDELGHVNCSPPLF
jgi:hypothetical protein